MTVQELIDQLTALPDKDRQVVIWSWTDDAAREPILVSAKYVDQATGLDNTIGII